jgi:hypothetical protein
MQRPYWKVTVSTEGGSSQGKQELLPATIYTDSFRLNNPVAQRGTPDTGSASASDGRWEALRVDEADWRYVQGEAARLG